MEIVPVVVTHVQLILTEHEAAMLLSLFDPLPTGTYTQQENVFCIDLRSQIRTALKVI